MTAIEDKGGSVTTKIFFVRDRNPASNLSGGEPSCGTVKVYAFNAAPVVPATTATSAKR
jgi:hypothetical protein